MREKGSLDNLPHKGQSPDMYGWVIYIDEHRNFELLLPPGVQLHQDETAPPGEIYLYWSPVPSIGTFSIYLQKSTGRTAYDFLEIEKGFGSITRIEADENILHNGYPAHHLRFKFHQKFTREVVKDPLTGEINYLPERESFELQDFLFFSPENHDIRAGYRINLDASQDLFVYFETVLEHFRLLRTED